MPSIPPTPPTPPTPHMYGGSGGQDPAQSMEQILQQMMQEMQELVQLSQEQQDPAVLEQEQALMAQMQQQDTQLQGLFNKLSPSEQGALSQDMSAYQNSLTKFGMALESGNQTQINAAAAQMATATAQLISGLQGM